MEQDDSPEYVRICQTLSGPSISMMKYSLELLILILSCLLIFCYILIKLKPLIMILDIFQQRMLMAFKKESGSTLEHYEDDISL